MEYIVVFILGIAAGGFLNVCIYRISEERPVLYPPSYCSACGRRLMWYHMIPMARYIFLKGKCGFCGNKITPVNPVVELAAAALYTAAFHRFGTGVLFMKSIVLISLLLVVSPIDIIEQVIPDSLIVLSLATGVVFAAAGGSRSLKDALFGSVIGGGVLLAIASISRGGMGGGDVKLMAAIGLLLGWRLAVVTLFISFVSGGMFSIILLLTGERGRKDPVPFGPFLCGSAVVAMFCGRQLISLYLSLIKGGGMMGTH